MANFDGFARPASSYYRLPNSWFDHWADARKEVATGDRPARIIAPLKVMEYVIKYTWGFSNFDKPIRLSHSDLREGRRGKRGQRLDAGTGLASEATLQRGIKMAVAIGMLEQHEDSSDVARQKRFYLPRLRDETEEDEELPPNTIGFDRPASNYFIVPNAWTNISANIGSEVLILSIEYFFRHTWGWQIGDKEIRWLDADDVANGRRYRSDKRRGERYDQGIGYTVRQVRDALEEAVQRELLIWREREDGGKEYTLRMSWMTGIDPDGYFDPDDTNQADVTATPAGQLITSSTSAEKGVEVEEKTVEVTEKGVGGQEKLVEVEEKTVEEQEKDVESMEKGVGRTCRDTSRETMIQTPELHTSHPNTQSQDTGIKTPTTHPACAGGRPVVGQGQPEGRVIFFRPFLEDDVLGAVQTLTIPEAAQLILCESGVWYWSEADLRRPRTSGNPKIFTPAEIAAQIAFDEQVFGQQDFAILEEGYQLDLLPFVELVRQLQIRKYPVPIYLDLWQLLQIPPPEEVQPKLIERQTRFEILRTQTEGWGDPDLITALEKINLSPNIAQDLIIEHGASTVGGWLRALRKNSETISNIAGVLISHLRKRRTPPGEPMTLIMYPPSTCPDKVVAFSKARSHCRTNALDALGR